MNFSIMGFLPDDREDREDPFIKYYREVAPEHEPQLLFLVGHKSLGEMAGSDWPLTADQAGQIASIINVNLPIGLEFFLTVVP